MKEIQVGKMAYYSYLESWSATETAGVYTIYNWINKLWSTRQAIQ